jgi:hypothetical protein
VAISIVIIVVSTILFVYWFRYTCILILSTRNARDYARQVAEVNGLNFVETQQQLATDRGRVEAYDGLHKSLDRDYEVISYLLRHAGTRSSDSLDEHLLRIDYQIMRLLYFLARPFSRASARQALIERASIVSHLASAMGERVALPS